MTDRNPASSVSRRDFLKTGTAAGAGAMLGSLGRTARAQSPGNKVNVALVGFGAQGRVLLESLQKMPEVRITAICDVWDYARTYGARLLKAQGLEVRDYPDHETMLEKEKDLQVVIVATPDFTHAPITNAALKAGLNVYCEKMMSNTIEGARSMVRTMKETGKLLQIGHQRRSNPRYIFARERLLKEAKICGQLTAAHAQWNRAIAPEFGWPKGKEIPEAELKRQGYDSMRQFRNWRWFRALGGGPLSDLGAHQIDIFGWFIDHHPTAVLASGGSDYFKDYEWYDQALAIFEFARPEGMVRASYQTLSTTSAGAGYYEYFMGINGSLRISENPRMTAVYREAHAPKWDEWVAKNYLRAIAPPPAPASQPMTVDVRESPPPDAYNMPMVMNKPYHMPHLENFLAAVRGEGKLNCPADEAFRGELPVHKANEAIAARKTLEIKPEEYDV
jgi:predicted dehydrogenase